MAKRLRYIGGGVLLIVLAVVLLFANPGHSAAVPPPEIAVLSGVASHGEMIPLPTYTDGTVALEADCHWIVSVNHLMPRVNESDPNVFHCSADGRLVQVYWCNYHDCSDASGKITGSANLMIIATRGSSAPTPAHATSFGELKVRYR